MTFLLAVADGGVQEFVDLVTGVELDVYKENHGDQDGEDDNRVNVTGQEGSLETTRGGVQDDTPGDQEGCQTVVHPSEGFDGGGPTEQQHGRDDNVGAEAEEEEGQVGSRSPTSIDDFCNGVGGRSDLLEVDSQDTKQQDLDSGTRGVPVVDMRW